MVSRRPYTRLSDVAELTDLNHETSKVERVFPHEYPSAIADHFRQAPQGHDRAEDPCSPFDAESYVDDQGNGEEDEKDGVGC